jgi:4-hydroxy-tetrahydrodipicolinate reductase
MRIALIGRGRMGQAVRRLAEKDGDEIGVSFSSTESTLPAAEMAALMKEHDVAVDFSNGSAVGRNVDACLSAGLPLVEGTTGWDGAREELLDRVRSANGALVYAANFSIGIDIFYRIVSFAGRLFRSLDQYGVFLEEAHHAAKRDAPSGTALEIRKVLEAEIARQVPVASTRAGHIPGTHRVGFDGPADQVLLTHTARSRDGFATGALLAARWIAGRRGVYGFHDVLDDVLEGGGTDDGRA